MGGQPDGLGASVVAVPSAEDGGGVDVACREPKPGRSSARALTQGSIPSPSTEYECVYCGHACTKSAHIDPDRDTHSVMAVRASWAIASDQRPTRRVLAAIASATSEEDEGVAPADG